ncbi:MAG: hypothetical protein ACLSVG_11700 [Clostridia bacterium]
MPEDRFGEMKMKTKGNLWSNKRKTFIFCIVIVMVVAVAVSFISFFKADIEEEEEEKTPYDSMYNASRYFFRVFYPDDWDVNVDSYGFFLNAGEGIVLELFPLKKVSVSPGPTAAGGATPAPTVSPAPSSPATIDPRAGMERNTDLTMTFYYKEYDALYEYIKTLVPSAAPDASSAPSPEPTPGTVATPNVSGGPASSSPEKKEPPMKPEVIADYVFEQFQKEHEAAGYGYSTKKKYDAEAIEFLVLPYSYVKDDLKMKGELYVAARAMAYYVVQVEGTESAFGRYDNVVQNILYNMTFSVFDY